MKRSSHYLVCGIVLFAVFRPDAGWAADPIRTCFGLCDASAAVALDPDYFAVADDEDNVIRVYHRREGAQPVHSLDLSQFLGVDAEADIEAGTRLGDLIFWITSHGCNANGKVSPSRQRFFATTGSVRNGQINLRPAGRPYARLLQDLTEDPRLQPFDLATASRRAPKSQGALNIEGLVATREGQLLIGFRNPIPNGFALLVPLRNPSEVIQGQRANLGDPILLKLNGSGVRSITRLRGQYLVIGGSYDGSGPSDLYAWTGGMYPPQLLDKIHFTNLVPESIAEFFAPFENELLVVSDDGNVKVGKKLCKRLKDPQQKRFRVFRLEADTVLPNPPQATTR